MGLFRRRQGRHARGAPVVRAAGPAVAAAPEPWLTASLPYATAVRVAPVAPGLDDGTVVSGIAALIASGEAWSDPSLRSAPVVDSAQLPVVAPAPPPSAGPCSSTVLTVPAPFPMAVPRGLAAALATAPPAAPPRVQLGFRDGSTASLDPDSDQAAALEQLAILLNLRD